MSEDTHLLDELAGLRKSGRLRSLRTLRGPIGPVAEVDGRHVLILCSNNYLGLATDERLKAASCSAINSYGTGATGSRLISGNSELYTALEEDVAHLKSTEAALVFSSGYHANLGAITALAGPADAIFSDELNHASIIDGARLSRASIHVYRHGDVAHLEQLLINDKSKGRKLIADRKSTRLNSSHT